MRDANKISVALKLIQENIDCTTKETNNAATPSGPNFSTNININIYSIFLTSSVTQGLKKILSARLKFYLTIWIPIPHLPTKQLRITYNPQR